MASQALPAGDFLLQASLFVSIPSAGSGTASVQCSWSTAEVNVTNGSPSTIKDVETTMKDDVLTLPIAGVHLDSAAAVALSCNTISSNAVSLNATVVATQVSVLHDS